MTKDEMIAQLQAKRDATSKDAMIAQLQAKRDAAGKPPEPTMAGKILKGMGKHNAFFGGMNYLLNGPGLDQLNTAVGYGSGFTRTGVAQLADLAQNHEPTHVTSEDWQKALQGKAPRLADYMRRMGANEGVSMNLPLVGPVSQLDIEGNIGEIASDPVTWADPLLKGLGPVKNLFTPARRATEKLGDMAYRSGVKNLDLEAARYNKDPVSEVLKKYGIWGSPESMQQQIDELADKLLVQKNDIIGRATRNGAEVDMNSAVKRAQDFVDEMRKTAHPENQGAIDALQARIDKYKARGAKEPEQYLGSLPYSAEEKQLVPKDELFGYKTNNTPLKHEDDLAGRTSIPGQSTGTEYYSPTQAGARNPKGTVTHPKEAALDVINNAADEVVGLPRPMDEVTVRTPKTATTLDETERIPGPPPSQIDQWKSINNGVLPEDIWQQLNASGEGAGFDKALNGGLRDEVERSVSNPMYSKDGLSPFNARGEGEKLHNVNDELGRLLTSQDRAARDAEIATRKNFLTPVDTALMGTAPWVAMTKKIGDVLVRPSVRTGAGLALDRLGQTRIPDVLARKLWLNANQNIPEYLRKDE